MSRHMVSADTLEAFGGNAEEWFRHVAREKPGAGGQCAYCGQDHRGPAQYWPEGELARHNSARSGFSPPRPGGLAR